MSVPHLDTRVVDGNDYLMFGPYAGFSPKFLKRGRFTDLPFSVRGNNLPTMLGVAKDNTDLVTYLLSELAASKKARFAAMNEFIPEVDPADWEFIQAGQRVQVMKHDAKRGGVLGFGTELVSSADGSIAALLGASPGASTAVAIMLGLLKTCFPVSTTDGSPRSRTWSLARARPRRRRDSAHRALRVHRQDAAAHLRPFSSSEALQLHTSAVRSRSQSSTWRLTSL